jgi:hypothetical protein
MRVAVALDAGELIRIAPEVELNGMHQLSVGDPRLGAIERDDSWVLATIGALTAVTSYVRLGAVLTWSPR